MPQVSEFMLTITAAIFAAAWVFQLIRAHSSVKARNASAATAHETAKGDFAARQQAADELVKPLCTALENRVSVRRFQELEAVPSHVEIEAAQPVDQVVRILRSPELALPISAGEGPLQADSR